MSSFRPLKAITNIDGVDVGELISQYGSPLFVFSKSTLVAKFRELRDAFSRRYPSVRLAWSYKTNYLNGICRLLHAEGAWAEVVSEFEYDKAISNGVPSGKIHFNGPYKGSQALEKAISGGSILHIDHFNELTQIEKTATRLGRKPEVAIRINMSVSNIPGRTRFGFNLEDGQALDAVKRIVAGGILKLSGLHCHLGTFIQSVDAYREEATKLAMFANKLREQYSIEISFIDIGGGFASPNPLKGQYLTGEQATPTFERYADAVCDGLAKLDRGPSELPVLVLETGRALVDEAGYLITTVHAVKRLPDGRTGLVVDAGVNVLFTSFWYNHEVLPARHVSGMPIPTTIIGPLCMNIDVIREAMSFPQVGTGDLLVVRNVGAYNVTQWMQFITYRPAVVIVGNAGKTGLLRRRETLEDIMGPEQVPEWL